MKKLLLILLCLPMIGFGQFLYKLDSTTASYPILALPTTTYEYDSQGNNTKITSINMGNSTSHISDSIGNILFSYDAQLELFGYNTANQLISAQKAFLEFGSQNIVPLENLIFFYDSNNNLISIERERTATGNFLFNNSSNFYGSTCVGEKCKTTFTYDINNQNTLQEEWDWDGSTYVPTIKREMFWQSGIITHEIYYINPPAWEISNVYNYIYSSGDLLHVTEISYNGGVVPDTSIIDYYYNNVLNSNTAGDPHGWYGYIITGFANTSIHQIASMTMTLLMDPSFALTHTYHYSAFTSTLIEEHTTNKQLLKVTDLLGRETKGTNQPLFYIYDDGTVEKRIVIE